MTRLHRLVTEGLEETADLFTPVRELFGWVYRAAHELGNPDRLTGAGVRGRWDAVVRGMDGLAARRPDLADPLRRFVKVSRGYEPGLFHGYDVPGLPRTNNDLEQLFGSHRHHERRSSGRKVASPGLVVRGSVRLVAGRMVSHRSIRGVGPPTVWTAVRARPCFADR